MRKSGLFMVTLAIVVVANGVAFAQSPTEGPLAAPGDAPHAAAKPAKRAKHKKIAIHAARPGQEDFSPDGAAKRDLALPHSDQAADPMSFGMKWNGNSDNARETRVQNYNAGAAGSGAEVGMKLHF